MSMILRTPCHGPAQHKFMRTSRVQAARLPCSWEARRRFLEDSIAPSSGRPVEQFVPTEDAILQQPLSQPD